MKMGCLSQWFGTNVVAVNMERDYKLEVDLQKLERVYGFILFLFRYLLIGFRSLRVEIISTFKYYL